MRRLVLILFACLLSTLAVPSTPHWKLVAGSSANDMDVFIDTNSLKTRGGRLSAWVQVNYNPARLAENGDPRHYHSAINLEVFDCGTERSGIVATSIFAGYSGEGELIGSSSGDLQTTALEYHRPGSVAQETLEAVCRLAEKQSR